MEIKPQTITINVTNRELYLIHYAIDELFNISNEMDLKRGFGQQIREEMHSLRVVFEKALNETSGR